MMKIRRIVFEDGDGDKPVASSTFSLSLSHPTNYHLSQWKVIDYADGTRDKVRVNEWARKITRHFGFWGKGAGSTRGDGPFEQACKQLLNKQVDPLQVSKKGRDQLIAAIKLACQEPNRDGVLAGVYILIDENPFYVGQSSNIPERVFSHLYGRNFPVRAMVAFEANIEQRLFLEACFIKILRPERNKIYPAIASLQQRLDTATSVPAAVNRIDLACYNDTIPAKIAAEAFDLARESVDSEQVGWLKGIENFYDKNGRLSEKQVRFVELFANRTLDDRRRVNKEELEEG